jgi:hypothetical protein
MPNKPTKNHILDYSRAWRNSPRPGQSPFSQLPPVEILFVSKKSGQAHAVAGRSFTQKAKTSAA